MFTEPITLKQINQNQYVALLANGKSFGTIETADDGYFYYYFPTDVKAFGFIDTGLLRLLADKIDELNEPYDRLVAQQLQKSRQPREDDDLVPFWAWD